MRRTTTLLVGAIFSLSLLSGCFVTSDRGHRHGYVGGGHACRPSQHWDGHTCRHNGQGRGARKHDGR